MKNQIYYGIILGTALLMISCQEDSGARGSGDPAIEQAGFGYLTDSGVRIQKALQTGREKLTAGNEPAALASIKDAESAVWILLYYDVPMTEVRQLIYDAGRIHAMQRQQDALNLLKRSAEILLEVEQRGGSSVHEAMQEIRATTSDLQMLLEEETKTREAKPKAELSKKVAAKFEVLWHKVNMLVLKSNIVLSGADFDQAIKVQ